MAAVLKINSKQSEVLAYLIGKAHLKLPDKWGQDLHVINMEDGGMGSFSVVYDKNQIQENRSFGRQASDFTINDEDGIPILVTLYLDENDLPYEVDVWKINYSPVIKLHVPS